MDLLFERPLTAGHKWDRQNTTLAEASGLDHSPLFVIHFYPVICFNNTPGKSYKARSSKGSDKKEFSVEFSSESFMRFFLKYRGDSAELLPSDSVPVN
jgi:hypothetical protein